MSRLKKNNISVEEIEALETKNEILETKLEQHEKRLDNLEKLVFSHQGSQSESSQLINLLTNMLQSNMTQDGQNKNNHHEDKKDTHDNKKNGEKSTHLEFGRLRTII